jgi:hypothetical protein
MVQQQIQTQRETVARRWVPTDRVFALSARDGLAARMSGQRRRPEAQPSAELEDALSARPAAAPARTAGRQRRRVVDRVRQVATRRIGDRGATRPSRCSN